MAQVIKFLREQIKKKNFIIRSLFTLKPSNREEDNFESYVDNKIPVFKWFNKR